MQRDLALRIRGILRVILSLFFSYALFLFIYQSIKNYSSEELSILLGHVTSAIIILWFSIAMLLNGFKEIKFIEIKYKTYLMSFLFTVGSVYVLLNEITDQKRLSVIIFGMLVLSLLSYLSFCDARFFRLKKKSVSV